MKVGQAVRTDGPQTHLVKSGTPTMGGVLVLIAIGVSTLLWADLSNRFVWVVLIVTLGYGAIGWVDDYRKVVHKDPERHALPRKIFLAIAYWHCGSRYLSRLLRIGTDKRSSMAELFVAWTQSGFTMRHMPSQ